MSLTLTTDEPVGMGKTEHGDTLYLPVPGSGGRNWLVGGATGAGKSEFLNAAIGKLARRPHLALTAHDPKRVELSRWGPRLTLRAVGAITVSEFLALHIGEMEKRYRFMEAEGLNILVPSARWPRVVAIFDEFAAVGRAIPREVWDPKSDEMVMQTKAQANAEVMVRHNLMEEYITMGRAAGMGCIICTQRPEVSVVPGSIRDNTRVRIAFGCESGDQARMILGDVPEHVRPQLIPESSPGVAWAKVDRRCVRFRGYRVPDEVVGTIVEQTATLRSNLAGWPESLEG